MPCADENFQWVLTTFQKSANPFIPTGDNDWSDCVKLKARKFDPLERLGGGLVLLAEPSKLPNPRLKRDAGITRFEYSLFLSPLSRIALCL